MNPPRKGDLGNYYPMQHGSDEWLTALVVWVNDDDSLNLKIWGEKGHETTVLNVPAEDDAGDGVHFYRGK